MENVEFEEAIRNAVNSCADETGWANLAEVGTHLRNNGVQYGKLSKFLKRFAHIVETQMDSTIEPPVMHAKLLNEDVDNVGVSV